MNSSKYLGLLVLTVVTVVCGVLQGKATFRWGAPQAMGVAAEKLTKANFESGQWELKERQTFAPDVLKLLQSSGYLKHVYQNTQTQSTVSAAVFIGPAGPLVTHTPVVCYPANDYEIHSSSRIVSFGDIGPRQHELKAVTFRSNDVHHQFLRVYYGWAGSDGVFTSPEMPRLAFAEQPFLYRLQVAVRISDGNEDVESDEAMDFLAENLLANEMSSLLAVKVNAIDQSQERHDD